MTEKLKTALAFDIGGTKIYYALITENGDIVSEITKTNTPKTTDEIVSLIKTAISECGVKADIVAIATAGAVDTGNSRVISSTGNLPADYNTINFKSLTEKPVFVENDANSAAWAEYKIGSSKGCRYSVMLTLGTGVGGGIILDGKLYKGKSGAAGEMHFKMSRNERRKCTCGAYDCFEIYASGNGLKLTAQEMLNDESITSYDVINGVKNNDTKMIEVFNRWQNDISDGIIGLANLFDPDCIVLSGSMAEFTDIKSLEHRVNSQIVTMPLKIVLASSGNYSGMQGAVLLAFEVLNGVL